MKSPLTKRPQIRLRPERSPRDEVIYEYLDQARRDGQVLTEVIKDLLYLGIRLKEQEQEKKK